MPKEFYSLTFYEYSCILAGYNLKKSYDKEHTRMISYTLYAVNSTEKNKPGIYKWWPLLTDKNIEKPKTEIHSPEEKEELMKTVNERLQLLNRN